MVGGGGRQVRGGKVKVKLKDRGKEGWRGGITGHCSQDNLIIR